MLGRKPRLGADMDQNRSTRAHHHRQSKPTSADHLLGMAPWPENSSDSSSACEVLSDDDVLWVNDLIHRRANPRLDPRSSSTPLHIHRNLLVVRPPDSFGIVRIFPEQKTSSATSSSRMIPNLSKDRRLHPPSSATAPTGRYHHSMPVNVPVLPAAMMNRRRRREIEDDDREEGTDDDRAILPPHEMVARRLARSQMMAFSVLEGAGRTLKGRDLRQVRNAVFRRTGFLD